MDSVACVQTVAGGVEGRKSWNDSRKTAVVLHGRGRQAYLRYPARCWTTLSPARRELRSGGTSPYLYDSTGRLPAACVLTTTPDALFLAGAVTPAVRYALNIYNTNYTGGRENNVSLPVQPSGLFHLFSRLPPICRFLLALSICLLLPSLIHLSRNIAYNASNAG